MRTISDIKKRPITDIHEINARTAKYSELNYGDLEKSLHSKSKFYSKFEDIDFEKVNREIDIFYINKENNNSEIELEFESGIKSINYYNFIKYLSTLQRFTYDEKMYIYINCLDPELFTVKEFIKVKNAGYQINKMVRDNYKRLVREKIGFFDPVLINLEKDYYHKFEKNKENEKKL